MGATVGKTEPVCDRSGKDYLGLLFFDLERLCVLGLRQGGQACARLLT